MVAVLGVHVKRNLAPRNELNTLFPNQVKICIKFSIAILS